MADLGRVPRLERLVVLLERARPMTGAHGGSCSLHAPSLWAALRSDA